LNVEENLFKYATIIKSMAISYRFIREGFSIIWKFWMISLIIINSVLHISSEMSDQTLYWPSSSITKSANCVSLNLI